MCVKLDVYSFALTLWEMHTTCLPWTALSLEHLKEKVLERGQRPAIPRNMAPEYAALIQECWAMDPLARPTFSSVRDRLRALHPDAEK